MRIIGGKHKGRVLAEFSGYEVRPTADRVKESLFNVLFQKIEGARVLDLFSGSGALGLECISRGAREAVFNDVRKESVELLKKNLQKFGDDGKKAIVFAQDALTLLPRLSGTFDLVFLDPPYKDDCGLTALRFLGKSELLNENSIVVYERDRAFADEVDGLEKYDERKYGKTVLTFFKKEERQ